MIVFRPLMLALMIGLASYMTVGTVRADNEIPLKIHTVLPKDAISAILKPEFVSVDKADIADEVPVIGVVLNQEAHAYSAVLLNSHEIVNDTIGGTAVATTW